VTAECGGEYSLKVQSGLGDGELQGQRCQSRRGASSTTPTRDGVRAGKRALRLAGAGNQQEAVQGLLSGETHMSAASRSYWSWLRWWPISSAISCCSPSIQQALAAGIDVSEAAVPPRPSTRAPASVKPCWR